MQVGVIQPTVLIVPGLRDHVPQHWQALLQIRLEGQSRKVRSVPPMGRANLDCETRVAAIEREVRAIDGPVVAVAHSGGCVMLAHWVRMSGRRLWGALLATPPDFEEAMPAGYPSLDELRAGGWLPVPRHRLPFPSIVAASRNDPLGRYERVSELAHDWGSRLVDLGEVGHLNPASGFGTWHSAEEFINQITVAA
jgi:predicted alpha/beta hydrolase family esterase